MDVCTMRSTRVALFILVVAMSGSVKSRAAPKTSLMHKLIVNIHNRIFNNNLLKPTSTEYKTLFSEVESSLNSIYGCSSCSTKSSYQKVSEMTFRNQSGTVLVEAFVKFPEGKVNADVLKHMLKKATDSTGKIKGLKINSVFTKVLPPSEFSTSPPTKTSTKSSTTYPTSPLTSKLTTSPKSDLTTHPISNLTTHPISNLTSNLTTHPISTLTTHPISNLTTHPISNLTSNLTTHPISNLTIYPISNLTSNLTTQPISNLTIYPISNLTTHPISNLTIYPISNLTSNLTTHPISIHPTHRTSHNATNPNAASSFNQNPSTLTSFLRYSVSFCLLFLISASF